jgi:spoIIIJ-associated protein
MIEDQLKELLSHSCFEIDVVEVDVRDNTALIFIDGDDAALLIGKEGYRYNALSYMLFNWLHTKYELFIKLEIAEFLTSQQEMIRNYIKPVIENVEKHGRGKTRSLDGILVQIALEQLREAFPNKYVAVKTGREGKKFVVINEFNNKNHA